MVLGKGIYLRIGIPDMGISKGGLESVFEEAPWPALQLPFFLFVRVLPLPWMGKKKVKDALTLTDFCLSPKYLMKLT